MQTWIKRKLAFIRDHKFLSHDLELCADAARILHEARQRAINAGRPDLAKLCRCGEFCSLSEAEMILSEFAASLGPRDQLLDAEELAKLLKVTSRTVWRRKSEGALPDHVQIGRCVRWRRADVDAWLGGN
jgi:excisionase family DNA binding protein